MCCFFPLMVGTHSLNSGLAARPAPGLRETAASSAYIYIPWSKFLLMGLYRVLIKRLLSPIRLYLRSFEHGSYHLKTLPDQVAKYLRAPFQVLGRALIAVLPSASKSP